MNCTHCKKEITYFRRSAEIPDRAHCHYIVDKCSNVMIAEIVDGVMISVEATPVDDGSPEVKAMIRQCYELMNQAGYDYYDVEILEDGTCKVVQDNHLSMPAKEEPEEEKEEITEEDCYPCRGCTHEDNCSMQDEKFGISRPNIFVRIFRKIFGR